MTRILHTAVAALLLSVSATAQSPFEGVWEILKEDKTPIRAGWTFIDVVVEISPDLFVSHSFFDRGRGWEPLPNETTYYTPMGNGSFTFTNAAGNSGQIDPNLDGNGDHDGTYTSTMTSGDNRGLQRHMAPY